MTSYISVAASITPGLPLDTALCITIYFSLWCFPEWLHLWFLTELFSCCFYFILPPLFLSFFRCSTPDYLNDSLIFPQEKERAPWDTVLNCFTVIIAFSLIQICYNNLPVSALCFCFPENQNSKECFGSNKCVWTTNALIAKLVWTVMRFIEFFLLAFCTQLHQH